MDISEFDLHAEIEDIHWWFKARREIMLDILKRYIPAGEGRLIAEIGCGTGGNLRFLQDYYKVIGVDISPYAVEHARKRVRGDIYAGDFREIPIDTWSDLEAVILADVLEHTDDSVFLSDIVKNLRAGAILLITVPAHMSLWSQHDVALGHKRRYSKKGLRSLYRGLPVEEIFLSHFNALLFFPIALFRKLRLKRGDYRKSDLYPHGPCVNYLLYKIFSVERILLRLFPLPLGLSYLVLLRKGGKYDG